MRHLPCLVFLFLGCAEAAQPCETGVRCNGLCVDLRANPEHCGACGQPCGSGEVCFADDPRIVGECRDTCPGALEACGGTCVDLGSNPDHCGDCGQDCGDGAVCVDGECAAICPAPRVACGGSCVDLRVDGANCGACDAPCGEGLLCSAGTCGATCQEELSACGGRCVDLVGDDANCGECGHACAPGNVCDRGACVRICPPGQTDCAGRCVDLLRDRTHCGACATACVAGEYCEAGACVVTCSPGLVDCDGVCIDVDDDPENCGDCGFSCGGPGFACVTGECRVVPLLTWPGVRTNVDISTLGGWEECYVGTYNLSVSLAANVLVGCDGPNLMLACRLTGDDVLVAAAHAPRADVLFDTGVGNVAHNANNVGWYYNNSYSWGFARQGDPLSRSSCDTNNTNPAERICYHTGGGSLNGGWRCGAATGLNGSVAYERVIYQY